MGKPGYRAFAPWGYVTLASIACLSLSSAERSDHSISEELAVMKKFACPHCGQDWVRMYRRKDTGTLFFMCPECGSLWLDESDIEEHTDLYLSEYLTQYDAASVWSVIEQVD
jgi:predicted RNA-binding Zn-ribbon protein involved in translation (DUF1610 family)